MIGIVTKQAGDTLDYELDYSRWLDEGDEITDATVDARAVNVDTIQIYPQAVKVWLSGGKGGASAEVSVRAVTQAGRIKTETFRIRVRG